MCVEYEIIQPRSVSTGNKVWLPCEGIAY